MTARRGSDEPPGAIPVYLDGALLAPGRTKVGAFPDADAAAGYRIVIVTDPDDPEWHRAVAEARK